MFGQQNAQPAIQTYNVNQVAQQFANWNYQLGQPYDNITGQIAAHVINEVQNTAVQTNHPIRIGAFNILSQNVFNNGDFNELLRVVMHRIAHGTVNREFNSINEVCTAVIPRVVKAGACAMANGDPEFMRSLQPNDAKAAAEQAQNWSYFVALANGQAPFNSFYNQVVSAQITPANNSTSQALVAARNLGDSVVDNFRTGGEYYASANNANNAGVGKGRYGRKMEAYQGAMQGSIQEAFAQAVQPGQQQAMPPINATFHTGADAIEQFDNAVEKFEQAIPAPEPVKPLFVIKRGGREINAIREIKTGEQPQWAPSLLQQWHPVANANTHYARYFETDIGAVFAVMHPYPKTNKDSDMDYEAHAIDPNKGHPNPTPKPAPVREEAKVLYAEKKDIALKIEVHTVKTMDEDINGSVRNVVLAANVGNKAADAHIRKSIVNAPVFYSEALDLDDDMVVVGHLLNAANFKTAAQLLSQIGNTQLRNAIDESLVKAINIMCTVELAIPARISNFVEDAGDLVSEVSKALGDVYGNFITEEQSNILHNNVIVTRATDVEQYAQVALSVDGGEDLSPEKLKTIVFVQRNVSVAWVKFTDKELAMTLPAKGAGHIQEEYYPALYAIVKAVFDSVEKKDTVTDTRLITSDGVRYNLNRSLVGPDIYLISKAVKE